MGTLAILFPGQGSQKPGMGRAIYEFSSTAVEIFDEIHHATGVNPSHLCFDSNEETLRKTENTQLALFSVSIATWYALAALKPDFKPIACAGHSIGEYSALACAGVFSVEQGARLVHRRGELMSFVAEHNPGAMAAILGADLDTVKAACEKAASVGVVVPANDNSPGQIVISGEKAAVEAAVKFVQEMGAKRAIMLNVSGGFHSPLMTNASIGMEEALKEAEAFKSPDWPVISNVTAQAVTDPSEWYSLLARQISCPVRWRESVHKLREMGVDTFIECGVGDVLTGLLKRIAPEAKGFAVNDAESLQRVAEEIIG